MFIQPVEAWTEVGPSAADGIEMDLLSGLICLHFVYLCVEVQNVNALRPLAFEDRANLRFKHAQQTGIDRAGAIDSDGNFSDALAHDSRQIEPVPDVAPVWPHPTRIGRDGVRPEPAQQLAPIDRCLCRTFESSCKARWSLAGLLRESDSLVDGYAPLSRLLFGTRRFFIGHRGVENLTDAAFRLRDCWPIRTALLF